MIFIYYFKQSANYFKNRFIQFLIKLNKNILLFIYFNFKLLIWICFIKIIKNLYKINLNHFLLLFKLSKLGKQSIKYFLNKIKKINNVK